MLRSGRTGLLCPVFDGLYSFVVAAVVSISSPANLFTTTTGNNQWSPAEVAAYYGSVASLKVLYDYGVDVFQDLTGNGQSPHEILWYRFQLSLQDLFENEDSESLGKLGGVLFHQALSMPSGFDTDEAQQEGDEEQE